MEYLRPCIIRLQESAFRDAYAAFQEVESLKADVGKLKQLFGDTLEGSMFAAVCLSMTAQLHKLLSQYQDVVLKMVKLGVNVNLGSLQDSVDGLLAHQTMFKDKLDQLKQPYKEPTAFPALFNQVNSLLATVDGAPGTQAGDGICRIIERSSRTGCTSYCTSVRFVYTTTDGECPNRCQSG